MNSVTVVKVRLVPVLLLGLSITAIHAAEPGPVIPRGQGESCVAETDFMRRNHMDLMIHQRDDTVIRGMRGAPFSLSGCVDCHAQKDAGGQPLRVDAEGQFCQGCHSFAAVKIDCFSCHAAVPDLAQKKAMLRITPESVAAWSNMVRDSITKLPDHDAREKR